MTGLTVNQLVDLLAQHINRGGGNDQVLVSLTGASEPLHAQLSRCDWEVRDLTPERAQGFVLLHGYPD